MKCRCCYRETPVFPTIDIVVGGKVFHQIISKEICADCLDPEDISVILDGAPRVKIDKKEKYGNLLLKNYLASIGVNRNNIYSSFELANKLKNAGIYKFAKEGARKKMIREFHRTWNRRGFLNIIRAPYNISNLKQYKYFFPKDEVDYIIDKLQHGDFKNLSHSLSKTQIDFLIKEEYAFYKDDKLYIYRNETEQKRPCLKCGKIKENKNFVPTSKKNNVQYYSYECRDCRNKNAKKYIDSLTPEQDAHRRKLIKRNTRKYAKRPTYRAIKNLRERLRDFMKTKDTNFNKNIGCTRGELVEYLEKHFTDGMSWDNYGQWHIDHIIPLSKFKGKSPNHYTNLQPLWAKDNWSKGAKIL